MLGEPKNIAAEGSASSREDGNSLERWADTVAGWQSRLRGFFARRVPGQEVDDLVSDVTIGLLQRRSGTAVANEPAYVFRSAANALKRKRSQPPLLEWHEGETEVDPLSPERHLIAKQMLQRVEQAIEQLSPRCRAVFVLSRYSDMTYVEIADHLGISVKMVEKHMSKALGRIAEAVDRQP